MRTADLPSLADITAAGRLADVLAAVELHGRSLPPTRRDRVLPSRPRLVYLVAPHGDRRVGQVLVAQARQLGQLGADVTVLSRAHPDDEDPGRAEVRLGTRAKLRHVPYGVPITDAVPPCDLVVAGSWEFVLPARMIGFAPVVCFDRAELRELGAVPEQIHAVVTASLEAASVVFALDPAGRDALAAEYGVSGRVAPDGPVLLQEYAAIVATSPMAEPCWDFDVRLGGLRFVRQRDRVRLRARLGACSTREVALPVSQPAFGPYRVVRWRVVARREEGEEGVTRLYLPATSDLELEDAPHQAFLDLLRDGAAEEALAGYAAACEQGSAAEQAVLGRWVALALLATGRSCDAVAVATAFAHDFPTQPDYVVLAVHAGRAARRPLEIAGPLERVRMLGAGTRYDEWFEDPLGLLTEELLTGGLPGGEPFTGELGS